ncbi:MAG TPA: nitroreductase [Chloroflexota bacterium]
MTITDDTHATVRALHARSSTGRVKPERPPRELIEEIIQAGAWAPNHYRTEPWRFIVLAGTARQALGEVMAQAEAAKLHDVAGPEAQQIIERERKKPLRAPVLIVVAAVPSVEPKVVEIEEIAATAAAVQNMLVAAEAVGLGAMWRTGPAAYDPLVKCHLGLPDAAHILAFVYVGFPDPIPRSPRNRDAARHTTWFGWSDDETTES